MLTCKAGSWWFCGFPFLCGSRWVKSQCFQLGQNRASEDLGSSIWITVRRRNFCKELCSPTTQLKAFCSLACTCLKDTQTHSFPSAGTSMATSCLFITTPSFFTVKKVLFNTMYLTCSIICRPWPWDLGLTVLGTVASCQRKTCHCKEPA